MSTVLVPGSAADALGMLEAAVGFFADSDPAGMPAALLAEVLAGLERADSVEAVARARLLAAFDAQDVSVTFGQRTTRTFLVHCLRVTKGQAAQHQALQALGRRDSPLLAALRDESLTRSEALQLAAWTRAIPAEFRSQAEQILAAAARAGADLRALAAICAEIQARTAPPDPDDPGGPGRGLSVETTMDGAGVLRGALTPQCAAMVTAVLDALSAPGGAGDLRTRPERYHDALGEAMRRLLASGLLPKRAGQPARALGHIHFTELLALDQDSVLQAAWITGYRARWAARRAAAAVGPGDGGAWLTGDAARAFACDAMIIPVVTGDLDPSALDDLIRLCVQYDHARAHGGTRQGDPADLSADPGPLRPADPAGRTAHAEALAVLEEQILARVIQIVSGPGGIASFLRRNLLGHGLAGPSLPLDVGQTDDIPVHLRRLAALRDQGCAYPGGCDQPPAACEPHHVVHRKDGGPTSLINLKDYCWWHHHILLHQLGWELTVHPDGTSTARSPDGKIIHSHHPPPRPG